MVREHSTSQALCKLNYKEKKIIAGHERLPSATVPLRSWTSPPPYTLHVHACTPAVPARPYVVDWQSRKLRMSIYSIVNAKQLQRLRDIYVYVTSLPAAPTTQSVPLVSSVFDAPPQGGNLPVGDHRVRISPCSYCAVCMISHVAVLVKLRLVTIDRRTSRQMAIADNTLAQLRIFSR